MGSRLARNFTDLPACSQSEVKYAGGPCNSGCCTNAASKNDSGLVVQNASTHQQCAILWTEE